MKNSFLCIIKELWYVLKVFCWTLKKKFKILHSESNYELKTIFKLSISLKKLKNAFFLVDIKIWLSTKSSKANSKSSVFFGLYDFTNNRKSLPSHIVPRPIPNLNLVKIYQPYISKSNKAYLHTGLYFCVLVHNRKDGLHTTIFHQIRFVPNQYQGQPEINRAHHSNKEGKIH